MPTAPPLLAACMQTQIVRFGGVSVLAAAIDYGVLYLLNDRTWLFLAVGAAFLAGTLVHYFLARRLVFRPSLFPPRTELLLVIAVGIIGLGLTEAIIIYLHDVRHWWVLAARTVALVIVFFWNYLARRYVIYDERMGRRFIKRQEGTPVG